MKFIEEFRDKVETEIVIERILSLPLKRMRIMEVCGSQTHAIMKYGLEELLPEEIMLVHGPGCPVCVTPPEFIDMAIDLAMRKDFILASYGDMLRVPGSGKDMLKAKADGADIRIIHSPLDAIRIARSERQKNVVLFAIGFETTAPANASAILVAEKEQLKNFFMISCHVLIPPAVEYILSSDNISLDGILAPGHVCSITGYKWCENISGRYKIPVTVTGFEPLDILQGIYRTAEQVVSGRYKTINQYKRAVTREGNPKAQEVIKSVFEISERNWRGLGSIPCSGLNIREDYSRFDAVKVFNPEVKTTNENKNCIAGEILQGVKKPAECILFGKTCSPENPVGAPMVSSEGACAAYFMYKRNKGILHGQ